MVDCFQPVLCRQNIGLLGVKYFLHFCTVRSIPFFILRLNFYTVRSSPSLILRLNFFTFRSRSGYRRQLPLANLSYGPCLLSLSHLPVITHAR